MSVLDSFKRDLKDFLKRHNMTEEAFSHAAFEEGIAAGKLFDDEVQIELEELDRLLGWMRVKDQAAGFGALYEQGEDTQKAIAADQTLGEYDYDRRMEIYKVMIDSTERAIDRRQTLNRFYFSVVVAIFVSISFVLRTGYEQFPTQTILATALFLAFLNCILWSAMIFASRRLNASKYDVICEFEKQMELAPFTREWEIHVAKGRNFPQFTFIELMLPFILSIVCLLLFVLIVSGVIQL
ncbi:MAG: RipA family octameric membrane protein [bacterium]